MSIPFAEYLKAVEQYGGKLVKIVGPWRMFLIQNIQVTVRVVDKHVLIDDLDDLNDRFGG